MRKLFLAAAPMVALMSATTWAQEAHRVQIIIKNHQFQPAELRVPANRPIIIDVHNQDTTAEEFESKDLGVEKVIAAGRQAPIRIKPLAPGRYTFIGEYHTDTAHGVIVAEGAN